MKLPRACPKSSVSRSVSEIAAQFTATNGREARAEWACMLGNDVLADAALAGDEDLGVAGGARRQQRGPAASRLTSTKPALQAAAVSDTSRTGGGSQQSTGASRGSSDLSGMLVRRRSDARRTERAEGDRR